MLPPLRRLGFGPQRVDYREIAAHPLGGVGAELVAQKIGEPFPAIPRRRLGLSRRRLRSLWLFRSRRADARGSEKLRCAAELERRGLDELTVALRLEPD